MGHLDYETLVSITYDAPRRTLIVRFGDGDVLRLPVDRLLPTRQGAHWEQASVEEGRHIHVPVAAGQGDRGGDATDVPWDTIRALTDPQFVAEMAQAAARNAVRIGATVRTLRRQRGLTTAELGARAGVAQQSISRLETGRHAASFSTLERLLSAMDCTLNDLHDADEDLSGSVSA